MSPKKTKSNPKATKSPASRDASPVGSSAAAHDADALSEAEHQAWLDRYLPVEQAIMADRERRRERRLELRAKRREKRTREFLDICEASEGMAARWQRNEFFFGEEFVRTLLRDGGYLAYIDWARRYSSKRVNTLRSAVRRPLYYARENERRRALAAERRRIRLRSTENPCPTKEQILDAWLRVKESHEATIRFGGLIEDLECYLDNSLIRNEDGAIVGRCPGVKGWLKDNLPALWLRYTTVMRYKAAAKKLRQIVGLSDPTPIDRVLTPGKEGVGTEAGVEAKTDTKKLKALPARDHGAEETMASGGDTICTGPENVGAHGSKTRTVPDIKVVRARAVWLEIAAGAGASPTSLVARIDALVDPKKVEDANLLREWRERYENEITVRTRHRWWWRLKLVCDMKSSKGNRRASA